MYGLTFLALLALGATAPAAHAQASPPPRQAASLTLGEATPGAASSLALAIDYAPSDGVAAKPYAVRTVFERLPAGARIDTSVPVRCQASDRELVARGAAACPPGSRVGRGEVALDTGTASIATTVTQFNATNELILLFEVGPSVRTVSRARIERGSTIVAQAPALPGGPPDGFTAIERVRLRLDRIRRGMRGYVTTPSSCPRGRAWTSTLDFTYRDGARESVRSTSPCTPRRRPSIDVVRRSASALAVNRRGGLRVALHVEGVATAVRARLVHRRTGATIAVGRAARLDRDGTLRLRLRRRARPGAYDVVVRTREGARASARVRLTA